MAPPRKGPPLKVFLQAAATTCAFSYPFYAVVSTMSHVGTADSLTPCNEKPCHFQRLFSAGDIPSTFGDHVRVQNGNTSRPVLMTSSAMTSATVAEHHRPLPREYTIGLGALFGGFLYQLPLPHNASEFERGYVLCILGICVDGHSWWPHLVCPFNGYRLQTFGEFDAALALGKQATDEYLQAHPRSRDVIAAVDASSSALSGFTILSWKVYKGPYLLFEMLFTGFHPSGVELFPSSLKDDSNPVAAWDECASSGVAESIENPLAKSVSAQAYLVFIFIWTIVKIVHDCMVLSDRPETETLRVGILTLFVQAAAIGAGFLAAMGAAQAFIAPLGAEPSSVCFFRMNKIAVSALIATPCLLFINFNERKQRIFMAIFCGDYLFYRKEHVPYKWLKSHGHDIWPDFSGMVPRLASASHSDTSPQSWSIAQESPRDARRSQRAGSANEKDSEPHTSTRNLLIFWASLKCLRVAEIFFTAVPMALAAGSICPFIMGTLVDGAIEEKTSLRSFSAQGRDYAMFTTFYVAMFAPAVLGVYLAWSSITYFFYKIEHIFTKDKEASADLEGDQQSLPNEPVSTSFSRIMTIVPERRRMRTSTVDSSDVQLLQRDSTTESAHDDDHRKRFPIEALLRAGLPVFVWLMNIALLLPPLGLVSSEERHIELLPFFEFWAVGGFWLTLSACYKFFSSPIMAMLSLQIGLRLHDDEPLPGWLPGWFPKNMKSYLLPGPRTFLSSVHSCPVLAKMFGLRVLEQWVTERLPHNGWSEGDRFFRKRWSNLLNKQRVASDGSFEFEWLALIKEEKATIKERVNFNRAKSQKLARRDHPSEREEPLLSEKATVLSEPPPN